MTNVQMTIQCPSVPLVLMNLNKCFNLEATFYKTGFRITLCRQTLINSRPLQWGRGLLVKKLVLKIIDYEIECEEVVKLLGMDIDYQLNLDQHISSLCRKTGQQFNVLKRLSPFFYLSQIDSLYLCFYFI